VARFPAVYKLLYGKYYVYEIYNAVFVSPMLRASDAVYRNFDLKVIDGTINGAAGAAGFSGRTLAYLQSGEVKGYALAILLGVVIFVGFLVFG
jgi:NADH-quinone oxidoreductase subunit L